MSKRWERRAIRIAWNGLRPRKRGSAYLDLVWHGGRFGCNEWFARLAGRDTRLSVPGLSCCAHAVVRSPEDLESTRRELYQTALRITQALELHWAVDHTPGVR